MVDRIRYPTVSYLPFYYVFFQFLLLTIFNLQANILTTKDILSNLANILISVSFSFQISFSPSLMNSIFTSSSCFRSVPHFSFISSTILFSVLSSLFFISSGTLFLISICVFFILITSFLISSVVSFSSFISSFIL